MVPPPSGPRSAELVGAEFDSVPRGGQANSGPTGPAGQVRGGVNVVSKQQVPLDVKSELRMAPPLARRTDLVVTKRPVPVPGNHLRYAVDSVLAELGAGTHPDPRLRHRLDDTLRGAL